MNRDEQLSAMLDALIGADAKDGNGVARVEWASAFAEDARRMWNWQQESDPEAVNTAIAEVRWMVQKLRPILASLRDEDGRYHY